MSIELRIRKLLNTGKKLDDIVEELLNLSASNDASTKEVKHISQFLINAGFYKEAFRQFPRRFYEKDHIPWPHFVELLVLNNIKVDSEVINAVFEGAQALKRESELVLNRKWDQLDLRFKEVRRQVWAHKLEQLEEKRQSLKQKLEFLRHHRMLEEENRAFQKYMEMFPDDQSISPAYQEFKERWSREVISRKVESRKSKDVKDFMLINLSAEEIEICDIILAASTQYLASEKACDEISYDFSLMQYWFGMTSAALKVLENAPEKPNKDWLRMELLMDNTNYFDVLEELVILESKFKEDPEAEFAIAYLRAKAYYKLGQKGQAAELLRSILRLRPNYRSAPSLLNEILEERMR